jgi:hypothetical protein
MEVFNVKVYMFIGIFAGAIEDVRLFAREEDALAEWERYTGIDCDNYEIADDILRNTIRNGSVVYEAIYNYKEHLVEVE